MIAIPGFIVSRIKGLEYGLPSIVNLCAVIQKQKYLHCLRTFLPSLHKLRSLSLLLQFLQRIPGNVSQ